MYTRTITIVGKEESRGGARRPGPGASSDEANAGYPFVRALAVLE
jgi:hypothetical protein